MNEEYLKLEYEYCKMFEKDEYDISIFPEFWFEIDDIKAKIDVLSKAIQEKKLIVNVQGGELFVEGIIPDNE